jgi:ornithine decarboxylase
MVTLELGGSAIGVVIPLPCFHQIAELIKGKLRDASAPKNLEVISEPGRYFVSSAFTLATSVHSIRDSGKPTYYISEGIYGSLNFLKYEPTVKPELLKVTTGRWCQVNHLWISP